MIVIVTLLRSRLLIARARAESRRGQEHRASGARYVPNTPVRIGIGCSGPATRFAGVTALSAPAAVSDRQVRTAAVGCINGICVRIAVGRLSSKARPFNRSGERIGQHGARSSPSNRKASTPTRHRTEATRRTDASSAPTFGATRTRFSEANVAVSKSLSGKN